MNSSASWEDLTKYTGESVSDWLEAIVVVAFHHEFGQVIEDIYSLNKPLSETAKRKICSLSLPDSNSGYNGDVQFIFRYRDSTAPLSSMGNPIDEDFMYCSAFFRQIKDKRLKRGYFQKSLVLVSRNPFITFLEDCAYIIGPLYYTFGSSVLEAILQNITTWPIPVPGRSYKLPIAGCLMHVQVPKQYEDIKKQLFLEGDDDDHHAEGEEAEAQHGDDNNNNGIDDTKADIPERRFVYESSNGGYMLKEYPLRSASKPKKTHPATNDDGVSSDAKKNGQDEEEEEDLLCFDKELENLAEDDLDFTTFERLAKKQKEEERKLSHGGGVSSSSGSGSACAPTTGKNKGNEDGGSVTLAEVFQNQEEQAPGLFQEIPLFSTFGGLSIALWHIWELALAGEPVLVLAPTPDRCSQAVLAIASLIAPITYNVDYRPYFSIYDSDFMEICKKHDEQRGQDLPAIVLGVTNPYFLKSLEFFPNVISMGGDGPSTRALARSQTPPPPMAKDSVDESASPRSPGFIDQQGSASLDDGSTERKARPLSRQLVREKEAKYQQIIASSHRMNRSTSTLSSHARRTDSLSVEGRDIHNARYHPTVATRHASLRALLTDQKYERSIILTRDTPIMSPDKQVLHQLVDEKTDYSFVEDELLSLEPPALAVNNNILRLHFRKLTKAFLKPLENYFKLESVGSRAARENGISLSAYNEPNLLRKQFNRESFLEALESQLPEKELRRTNWRALYKKFINGPNFLPWYNRERVKLEYQLQYIYRHLRLNTDPDVLLQAVGVNPQTREKILRGEAQKRRNDNNNASSGRTNSGNSNTTSDDAESATSNTLKFISQLESEALNEFYDDDRNTTSAGQSTGSTPGPNKQGIRLYMRVKKALDIEMAKAPHERDEKLCAKIAEHLEIVQSFLAHG